MLRFLIAVFAAVLFVVPSAVAVVPPDSIDVSGMFAGDPNAQPSWELCPECDGNQLVPGPDGPIDCPTCAGNGVVRDPPKDPPAVPPYDPPPPAAAAAFDLSWLLAPFVFTPEPWTPPVVVDLYLLAWF